MNMQFMLYEFKLGYNTAEATKNICCVKDESTVDRMTQEISHRLEEPQQSSKVR